MAQQIRDRYIVDGRQIWLIIACGEETQSELGNKAVMSPQSKRAPSGLGRPAGKLDKVDIVRILPTLLSSDAALHNVSPVLESSSDKMLSRER
jgi:hypothetical protein